jgi:hypothetical protein
VKHAIIVTGRVTIGDDDGAPHPSTHFVRRHPLPQGERGLCKVWIIPILYQRLAELPTLMFGSRLHIGNEIRLALPLISDINLFCYCQRIIYFDAEIPNGAFDLGVAEQKLDGPQITSAPINQSSLRAPQRMRSETPCI